MGRRQVRSTTEAGSRGCETVCRGQTVQGSCVDSFVKLYALILDSTVWELPPASRCVWITMLCMADMEGRVLSSVPGLARRSIVSIKETEDALAAFLAPDRYSRTADHEGRRITQIDGGWFVINHHKYRDLRTDVQKKSAARQKRYREEIARAKRGYESPFATVEPLRRPLHAARDRVLPSHMSHADLDLDLDPKDLEGVPKDLSGNAHATGDNPVQVIVALPSARSYFVPEAWEPHERHRVRCAELGLDLDEQVKRYREHEFERPLSEWNRRFDRWLTDARKFAETDAFKRSTSGKPREPIPQWQPESRLRVHAERRGLVFDELVLEYRREVLAKLAGKLPENLDAHFVAWLRTRFAGVPAREAAQ